MSERKGVTAEELVRALKKRKATLPAEIGTFAILETCEAMLEDGPVHVTVSNLRITEDGDVLLDDAPGADEPTAAVALHGALTSLLVAAGPAPTPALMRLVEEGPRGGAWRLSQLRDDLEASLVPLNRTASRRVLARLVRETGWNERPNQVRGPSFSELDDELSSLLGGTSPRDKDATMPDLVDDVGELDRVEEVEPAAPALRTAQATSLATLYDGPPVQAVASTRSQLRDLEVLDSMSPPRGSSRGTVLGVSLVVLALCLVGVTLALRPEALGRLMGDAEEPPPKAPVVVEKPAVGGDLVVHVSPARAQVLRFVGRGPAVVPNLPLGVAHEFVAVLDGQRPTRAIIAPNAEWEKLPEGSRYELAMQLGPAQSSDKLELGDTLLPKDVGRPAATLGSARIVTTPRGAKVYQVIGFAPDVTIADLPLDQTQELLVYLPGHAHVVRVISPSDFVEQGGRKVADVTIALTPTAKGKN